MNLGQWLFWGGGCRGAFCMKTSFVEGGCELRAKISIISVDWL